MAPVTQLRAGSGDAGDDDKVPAADVYKAAIDEYRFQATFNWSRTQYLLVFNAGIVAVASAVASRPGDSAALVFGFGVLAAVLSAVVVRAQHAYYRAARNRLKRVEEQVGIPPDQRFDTTSGLSGRPRRITVTQVVYLLLGGLALADVIGVFAVLS